jgi:four helix bundle protein
MKTHKDLNVWRDSIDLVTTIYEITQGFPKEEVYGLTNQIRRSAISIPSNIAEGAGRKSNKEFLQFLYYAMGSLAELETQIVIAYNLSYLPEENKEQLDEKLVLISKMLSGLITSVRKKEN